MPSKVKKVTASRSHPATKFLLEDTQFVKPPREKPEKHVYKVRWPLSIPEFEKVETGDKVTVKEFVPTTTVKTDGGLVDVSYLVKTMKGGLIPISYLQVKPNYDWKSNLEKEIGGACGFNDHRLGDGRWWAGRITPSDAAGQLLSLSHEAGEFACCQPPEWESASGKEWAEYCLVVRTFTGSTPRFIDEWRENAYYMLRNAKNLGVERKVTYDVLPSPPIGPPPPTLFFTIKRTANGDFFIENSVEFNSLEKLFDHYYNNPLPLKEPPSKKEKMGIVLRMPTQLNDDWTRSPRPVLWPQKCPGYKHEPFKLVQWYKDGTTLKDCKPLKWTHVLSWKTQEQMEDEKKAGKVVERDIATKAMIVINGNYNTVCIRMLKKNFSKKAFEKDMTRIFHAEGTSNYTNAHKEIIKSDLKSPKFRPGTNFISHIVSFGEKNESWIAYENAVGLPLDQLLMKRRYEDEFMSTRMKLEIAYQVAAGMRFLEENFLCHRHLRTGNCVVSREYDANMVIKITDYMVPYSYLDLEFVEFVDMSDLDYSWWAPECVRYRCFDIISDMWAYGCLIFELIHMGLPPYCFEDNPPMNAKEMQAILLGNKKMRTQEGDELDTYIDDLILRCMRNEYKERPTFDYMYRFLRQLLFDMTTPAEKTIDTFLNKAPNTFDHKWSRGKMKDRCV